MIATGEVVPREESKVQAKFPARFACSLLGYWKS